MMEKRKQERAVFRFLAVLIFIWLAGAQVSDPTDFRLFFSPTGENLKSGSIEISLYEFFFPALRVGITDSFSVAAGATLTGELITYIAPKLTLLRSQNTFFSVGGIYGHSVSSSEDLEEKIGYAALSVKNRKLTLALVFSYGVLGEEVSYEGVFVLGGTYRVGRHLKIMSENIFSTARGWSLYISGLRFFTGKFSADLGFVGSHNDVFYVFPWVSLACKIK